MNSETGVEKLQAEPAQHLFDFPLGTSLRSFAQPTIRFSP